MGCRDSLFFVKLTFVYVEFSQFGIKESKNSLFLAKKKPFVKNKINFGIAPFLSMYLWYRTEQLKKLGNRLFLPRPV